MHRIVSRLVSGRRLGLVARRLATLVAIVALLVPGGLAAPASEAKIPDVSGSGVASSPKPCWTNCNSKDARVARVYLGTAAGAELPQCVPGGGPVQATLWVVVTTTAQTRYNGAIRFDLYVDGVSPGTYEKCFAPGAFSDTAAYKVMDLTWECGSRIELQNVYIGWRNNSNSTCGSTGDCFDPHCAGAGTLVVEAPLVARFTASPGCDFSVRFDDTVTGGTEPYTRSWDFGDGGTSNDIDPTHTYASAGTYDVTLTVTDTNRTVSTFTQQVVVPEVVDVSITASPGLTLMCGAGSVTLTASASGGTGSYTYAWDLDADGQYDDGSGAVKTVSAAGSYSVLATDEAGCTDTASVTVVAEYPAPQVAIQKVVDQPYVFAGTSVNYTYLVTNTGACPLLDVSVTDDKLGAISLSGLTDQDGDETADDLAAGASATGTASATILTDTVNVATVTGHSGDGTPASAQDSASVTVYRPALSLTKVGSTTAAYINDTINYTLTVRNTGDVTLHNVTVVDTKLGINQTIASLAPGASQSVFGSYVVTEADLGGVSNTATADSDETESVSDTWNVEVAARPGLAISKTADRTTANIGDTIHYTIVVRNTGDVTLHNVTVVDARLGINQTIASLAPNASQSFSGSYLVTEADLAGVSNTATADSDETGAVSDTWEVAVVAQPGLSITKTADRATAVLGDVINYTIVVQNTGDVGLEGVHVWDDLLGLDETLTLGAGASQTFSGSYTVTEADVEAGVVHNTAYASSEGAGGVEDSVDVEVLALGLSLTKTADRESAMVGDVINYTIVVQNTGEATLQDVRVVDTMLGIDTSVCDLAPGASATVTATYTVQESDLPGPLVNTAVATSGELSAEDSATVALEEPTPTPTPETPTPTPETPTPTPTPTTTPPPPCVRSDLSVLIYGGWAGIPVNASVSGTGQDTQYTAPDSNGTPAVLWTFYPGEDEVLNVVVTPQLPGGLDPNEWKFEPASASTSIRRCQNRQLVFRLVHTTPPPEELLLPVTGARGGVLEMVALWWQSLVAWCRRLLGQ